MANIEIDLIAAAFNGDITKVKELILMGVDVNCVDIESNSTPLHSAIENYELAIVRVLLEQGADPNLAIRHPNVEERLSYPLGHALDVVIDMSHQERIEPGDEPLELVWMLLAYGANPNSGIQVAQIYGNERFVMMLDRFAVVRWRNAV